jgi:hypothetical protein
LQAVEVLAVLSAQGIVVEQGGSEAFEDLADYFPVGWAEVSAEGLAAREEELIRNDVGECSQDVRVQLDLAKGGLYIIRVRDDVEVWGVCPQSVDACEDFISGGAEEAGFFRPQRGGGHHIDRSRPWRVAPGGIEDLAVFFTRFLQDVLRGEEQVRSEPCYPVR